MRKRYFAPSRTGGGEEAVPFASVIEAWVWAVAAYQAKLEGARDTVGGGGRSRPCDPEDVIHAALRLHRKGRLLTGHLEVLVRYGREALTPDRWRHSQDFGLWETALRLLDPVLRDKGIVA